MKKFILILFGIMISKISCAQEIKVGEPEFTGVIMYINDTIGEGIVLEKQKAGTAKTKNAGAELVGYGTTTIKNTVQGAESPVRFSSNEILKFIVRVESNTRDPREIINIFSLDTEGSKRVLEVAKSTSFSKNGAYKIKFIGFSGKKFGQSSYLIELKEKLPEGEYAVTLEGSRGIFNLFGIN